MLIAGAGGHSVELLGLCEQLGQTSEIYFFDDFTPDAPKKLFDKFPVLKTEEEVREIFSSDKRFALGVGKPSARKKLAEKFEMMGGELISLISPLAQIGSQEVQLGKGLNIMGGAILTNRLSIGTGTLVHVHVSIHHDCKVGEYCELSPGCRILGGVEIGSLTSIGAGAVILPGRKIGEGVVVGAGALVSRDVSSGAIVKGVPAR